MQDSFQNKVSLMKYINQLEYRNLLYPTTLERDAPLCAPYPSVAEAGCGLCCACMMINQLTKKQLSVQQCIDLAIKAGANRFGTDLGLLGNALASRYNLAMQVTDSMTQLTNCLRLGGCAVANVGGDRRGYQGVLSCGGHFVLVSKIDRDKVWILDPAYTEEKYQKPHRRVVTEIQGDYVVTRLVVLEEDTRSRSPAFYLFTCVCS